MLNVIGKIAAVAVLALAPLTASALTLNPLVVGNNTISLGNTYAYQETTVSGQTRVFILNASEDLRLASMASTFEFIGTFQNLNISLESLAGTTAATLVTSSTFGSMFSLDALFDATNGLSQTLTVKWSGITGSGAQINIQATPAPVPVPAAGLMLLTALGGVAAMRRRKTA